MDSPVSKALVLLRSEREIQFICAIERFSSVYFMPLKKPQSSPRIRMMCDAVSSSGAQPPLTATSTSEAPAFTAETAQAAAIESSSEHLTASAASLSSGTLAYISLTKLLNS